MPFDPLDGVTPFLAVAEVLSFTAAAARLGVTPTAVSKAIRLMEQRHGVALFQRTTRRVALTEAGQAALLRLRPAAADIAEAFTALGGYREQPMGTLRITAPRSAAELFVTLIPAFRQACPTVTLEVSLNDGFVDIVAAGYDAGIRLGEAVEKDMVAIRLRPEVRWSIVGAPAYFAGSERPRRPEDLLRHEAIRYRFLASQAMHRWRFRRGAREFTVDVHGGLVVDDRDLLVNCAVQGLGLAFVADDEVRTHVEAGRLEPMLQSFIPSDSGVFLYFPKRSQSQLKLRAFIDVIRRLAAEAPAPGIAARKPKPGKARLASRG